MLSEGLGKRNVMSAAKLVVGLPPCSLQRPQCMSPFLCKLQNGVALCDVVSATATEITCRTRPHLVADASSDDPFARNVKAVPVGPGPVEVGPCADEARLRRYFGPALAGPLSLAQILLYIYIPSEALLLDASLTRLLCLNSPV